MAPATARNLSGRLIGPRVALGDDTVRVPHARTALLETSLQKAEGL